MKKLSKDSIRYIIYFIVFILLSLLIFRVKIVKDMIYLVFISFIVAYVLKPLNERLIKMGMNRRFSSVLLILMLLQ